MTMPPVNARTAAQLAFSLREQPAEVAAKVLTDLVPQVYKHLRCTCSHEIACRFVVAFMDQVVEAMRAPTQEIH